MSSSVAAIPSEFDGFLYALIGDDNDNGMQLSVLSALARQGVDPWEEAARLAVLSGEAATRKLTAWIAVQPDGKSTRPDAGLIAARLIALLPRQTNTPANTPALHVKAVVQSWTARHRIVYVIFVVLVLAAQWSIANHLAAGLSGNAAAPVSSRQLSPAASHLERADPPIRSPAGHR